MKFLLFYSRKNNGKKLEEWWYNENKLNRLDGPAYITYHSDGKIGCASYYVNNLKHRLHFPSIIRYSENGSKSSEAFNVNYENGNDMVRKMVFG